LTLFRVGQGMTVRTSEAEIPGPLEHLRAVGPVAQ